MERVIIFSGGGSSGHVMPSLAVADAVTAKDATFKPVFFCSPRIDEIETLRASGRKHFVIHAGKFPRGFSVRLIT
ncbi:MAG: glycosyltransferase, partial [Candidatus Peribacteraceae bacterium]|nr:glycosyltransferase [Candidatus Peribacteraceae bacterium]